MQSSTTANHWAINNLSIGIRLITFSFYRKKLESLSLAKCIVKWLSAGIHAEKWRFFEGKGEVSSIVGSANTRQIWLTKGWKFSKFFSHFCNNWQNQNRCPSIFLEKPPLARTLEIYAVFLRVHSIPAGPRATVYNFGVHSEIFEVHETIPFQSGFYH